MDSANSGKIVVKVDPDIQELIPEFLKNRNEDVAKIFSALKTNNFRTIETVGHQMKGSGGGYGFQRLSEIGASLESEAKNENSEKVWDLTTQLSDYLKRLEIVFE